MQKVIIIGAASGMGKAIALQLIKTNYLVAVADINLETLFNEFEHKISKNLIVKINTANTSEARLILNKLIKQLNGVDIFIYAAAIADNSYVWQNEHKQHAINAIGFAALANLIYGYYKSNNVQGQLVAFTSVLAERGVQQAITYCAGKAFVRSYLQGLEHDSKTKNLGITVTEICPGFVKTPMIQNNTNKFWVTPIEKATKQIVQAIQNKKAKVYVSKRWALIGWILRLLPNEIFYNRLFNRMFL